MITKNDKNSFAYARRVMCLPLFFILCVACSRNVDQAGNITDKSGLKNIENQASSALTERRAPATDTIEISAHDMENLFDEKQSAKEISSQSGDDKHYFKFDDGTVYALSKNEIEMYLLSKEKNKASNTNAYDKALSKVEMEPEFKGGIAGWAKFLNTTLKYPDEAIEKEIQGTVFVQFLVDKAGNVSDVKALSGPPVLQKEAVRVINLSKWLPARMNGRVVNSYRKQPITFRLQSE